jgi:hypothetical protein
VTIKFPNWGHKKPHKKDKKYLLIPSLNMVPAQRLHPSYNKSNARLNASSHIAFSSFITVCWVDETALNLVPFMAIFNLGNKKVSRC